MKSLDKWEQEVLALLNAGDLAFRSRQYEEAEQQLRVARGRIAILDLHPGWMIDCLNRLAGVCIAQGRFSEAEPLLRRAVELARSSLPSSAALLGSVVVALGEVRQAQECLREAEELLREGVGILKVAPEAWQLQRAVALMSLGTVYDQQRRFAEADLCLHEAFTVLDKPPRRQVAQLAFALMSLGNHYHLCGDNDRAEPLLKRAARLGRRMEPPVSTSVVRTWCYLADVYEARDKPRKAMRALDRALELALRHFGEESQPAADCLIHMAAAATQRGALRVAWRCGRLALRIREKLLGGQHGEIARTLHQLALIALARRKRDQAAKLYRRALRIAEQRWATDNLEVAILLGNMGILAETRGRPRHAVRWLQRALLLYEELSGPSHPTTLRLREILVRALRALGRDAEAEGVAAAAVADEDEEPSSALQAEAAPPAQAELERRYKELTSEAFQASDGNDLARAEELFKAALEVAAQFETLDRRSGRALYCLAELSCKQAKWAEALQYARRARLLAEQATSSTDLDVEQPLALQAVIHMNQRDLTSAEPLLRQSLALREKGLGPDHPEVLFAACNLAGVLLLLKRSAEGADQAGQAMALAERLADLDAAAVQALHWLASVCGQWGDFETAVRAYRRCLSALEQLHGPSHPDLAPLLSEWAELCSRREHFGEAASLYHRALAGSLQALPAGATDLVQLLRKCAACYCRHGNIVAAERLCLEARCLVENALGPFHPHLASCLEAHAQVLRAKGDVDWAEVQEGAARAMREAAPG